MVILGIDPGLAITGYGFIRKAGNKARLLNCGCILTSYKEAIDQRLERIFLDLTKLIEKYKPDCLVCEELFYFKNAKTFINVAQARGIVILVAKINRIPFYEYTPLQIKQALTGYGRADKKQMQEMIKELLNLKGILKPDDVSDACATAVCHAFTVKLLKS